MSTRRAPKRVHEGSEDEDREVKPSQIRMSQLTDDDINLNKRNSNGIIEKIHVRHFMCHTSMEINFNERINFVVGRNGSGKSAILMALVVGLGGKASATNRGSSLKEFIKKGEKTASVEIVLKNSGLSPYKHEVYGDRITIVRTISNGPGPAGYKIKAASGAVISTKREELDRVVGALNIQVDNPVSVLNQDTSRTFLNSSDPADKYNLFMRATELEKLDRYHKEAVSTRAAAMASVTVKKEALKLSKEEVDKLEKRWTVLKSIPEHKKKIESLENEHLWAQAIEKEKLNEAAAQVLTTEEARLQKLTDSYQNKATKEEDMQKKLQGLQAQLNELKDENSNYEQNWNAAKAKYMRCKESFTSKAKECKTLSGRIQRQKVNQDTLNDEIRRLQKETGPDYFERRAAQKLRLAELEVALAEKRATLTTLNHHLEQQRANEQPLLDLQRQLRGDAMEKTRRQERLRLNLQNLRENTGSNLALFGRHAVEIQRRIDNAHQQGKFSKKPVGPMGAYVQVRDAKWTLAVEACLGGSLTKYCCNTHEDGRVLTGLMRQVCQSNQPGNGQYEYIPSVVTSKFQDELHKTRRRAVCAEGYSNVYDMIVVSNTVVANALIDDCAPETVILLPTSEDAYALMANARDVPANCKRGYTMAGDVYFPSPGYKTYAASANRAKYLQVNHQQAIRQMADELLTVDQEAGQVKARLEALVAELAELRRQVAANNAERNKLRQTEQKISAEVMTLRDMAEPEVNCITTLTTELEECNEQIAEMQQREAELLKESSGLRDLMDEAKNEADELKQNAHAANIKEQPILAEVEQTRGDLRSFKTDQQYRKSKVDEQQLKVNKASTAVNEAAKVMTAYVANAEEMVPRINTRRKPCELMDEKRGLEVYLASIEREKGSYLEVTQLYLDKSTKYKETSQKVKENEDLCDLLQNGLLSRARYYECIRRSTTMAVSFYFKFRLQLRQYKGDITIDHTKKSLTITVTPAHRVDDAKKDTKTLSGGERSYSTVVFIMALWDSVNLPFYFMDEFDVFMDKVNRRVIMDMLLEVAKDKDNRQFVFLTPQDTSSIQTDGTITIHRMEDPRG